MKLARASKLFSLRDLLEIKNDPKYRVGRTPFGATYSDPMVYAGNAVPWKGKKGDAFWEIADQFVGEKKVGLGKALEKAISISKKYKGTKGVVCVIDPVTGMPKCMPRKAFEQMKEAGKVVATVPVM